MKYKQDHNKEDYISEFQKQILNRLNASKVVFNLGRLADKDGTFYSFDICLICYEKPSDFCHRHLVAEWLNKAGFECKEWDN